MDGCRIWLDLSALFSGVRKQSCIFVDHVKHTTVGDVQYHISRLFDIKCSFHILNDDWLLPTAESSRILRDNDTVRVVPVEDSKPAHIKQNEDEGEGTLLTANGRTSVVEELSESENCSVSKGKDKSVVDSNDVPQPCHIQNIVNGATTANSCRNLRNPFANSSTNKQTSGADSDKVPHEPVSKILTSDGQSQDLETDIETEPGTRKRKRIRRRKKKSGKDIAESVDTEPKVKETRHSPYIMNKLLQGVSHVLKTSLAPPNKKHIFFQDEHDDKLSEVNGKEIELKTDSTFSETVPSTTPSDSCLQIPVSSQSLQPSSNCEESSYVSSIPAGKPLSNHTGEGLSKLMSLSQQDIPVVFERKRSEGSAIFNSKTGVVNAIPSKSDVPITSHSTAKLVVLKSLPVKETVIQFKVLKMVNYSPVLSEPIRARVVSPDFTTSQIFVQILEGLNEFKSEKGRFSIEDEEESNPSEYMYLNWTDLIEPMAVEYQQ